MAEHNTSVILISNNTNQRRKQKKLYHFFVHVHPRMRAGGFLFLSVVVFLTLYLNGERSPWLDTTYFTCVAIVYALFALQVSRIYYRNYSNHALHIGLMFGDLLVFLYAIYLTGAEQSPMFPILLLRMADQAFISSKRAWLFVHLIVLLYLAFLLLMISMGHVIYWPTQIIKLMLIYGCGLYLVFLAREADSLRGRMGKVMRLSKKLVKELRNKSDQLAEQAKQLRHEKARVVESSHIKSKFLSNMSHELLTPIHGVLGMNEILLASALEEDQRECAQAVLFSASSLLTSINDILNLTEIENHSLKLENAPYALREHLEQVLETMAPRAFEKSLHFWLDYDLNIPRCLVGDPVRMSQVFTNLIGNGFKFTEQGEVVVTVLRTNASATLEALLDTLDPEARCAVTATQIHSGHQGLICVVRDTGIGIDEAQLEHIFGEFDQGAEGMTRAYDGLGLGLAISSRLVRLMNGRMGLVTQKDRGSSFWFTLALKTHDLENASPQSPIFHQQTALPASSCLLIQPQRLPMLAPILAKYGLHIHGVDSFAAAQDYLKTNQALITFFPFDEKNTAKARLFVDEIARKTGVYNLLPILPIMTSQAVLNSLKQMGIVQQLKEPISYSQLEQALQICLDVEHPNEVQTTKTPPIPARPLANLQVLIAEDNPVNQKFAELMIKKWGANSYLAANGAEAVTFCTQRRFDLILMDLNMPKLDGITATKHIRAGGINAQTAVLAVSADTSNDSRSRCKTAGIDGFVAKPVGVKTLMTEVMALQQRGRVPVRGLA